MNKRLMIISLLILCMSLVATCSTAVPTTTSVTADGNNSLPAESVDSSSGTKLNLNTASGDDFQAAIPGLGNRMVREFMEYRPYLSIQQFRKEIGKYVNAAQVAEYEKYVYVPVAINDSDSATRQQIPGLSADEAEILISARPFASTDDFLAKLSAYISADELTIAKTILGED